MANYTIKYSSSDNTPFLTGKASFVVPENGVNNTSTSLVLHGALSTDYGKDIWNNMVYLLENFCNIKQPDVNTMGQLWFDSVNQMLKVYAYNSTDNTFEYTPISPIKLVSNSYTVLDKPLVASDSTNINYIDYDTDKYSDPSFVTRKYVHNHFTSLDKKTNLKGHEYYSSTKLFEYDPQSNYVAESNYQDNTLVTKHYVDAVMSTGASLKIASNSSLGGVKIGNGLDIDASGLLSVKGYQTNPSGSNTLTSPTVASNNNGIDLSSYPITGSDDNLTTVSTVNYMLANAYATATKAGTIKIGSTLSINNGVADINGMSVDGPALKRNGSFIVDGTVKVGGMLTTLADTEEGNSVYGYLSPIDPLTCINENAFVTKAYVRKMILAYNGPASPMSKFTVDANNNIVKVESYFELGPQIDVKNGIIYSESGLDVASSKRFTTAKFVDSNFIRKMNITDYDIDFDSTYAGVQIPQTLLSYGEQLIDFSSITGANTNDSKFKNILITKNYVDVILEPLLGPKGITSSISVNDKGNLVLTSTSALISGSKNNQIPENPTTSDYDNYFITKLYGDNNYVSYKKDSVPFSNTPKTISGKIKYDSSINIKLKKDDSTNTDEYTLVHRKYIDDILTSDSSPLSAITSTGEGADKKLVITDTLTSDDIYNGLKLDDPLFDPASSDYDTVFLTKGAGDKLYAKAPKVLKRGWLYYNEETKKTEWDLPWFDSFDDSKTGQLTVGPNTLSLIAGKKDNGITDASSPSFNNYFVTNELLRNNYVYKPDPSAKNKYVVIDNFGKIVWLDNVLPTKLDSGVLVSNGINTSWSKTTTENQVLTSKLDLNKVVYTWQPGVGEYFTYDKNTSILLSRNTLTVDLLNPYNGIKTDVLAKPTEDKYTNHFITKAYIDSYGVQYIDGGTFNVYENTTKTLRNKLQYGSTITYDTSATDLDKYTLVHKKYVDDKLSTAGMNETDVTAAIDAALDSYFNYDGVNKVLSPKDCVFSSKDATNGIDLTNESKGNNNFVTFNILKKKFLEIVGTDGTVNADSVMTQFSGIVDEVAAITTDIADIKTKYFTFDTTNTETTSKYKLKANSIYNSIPVTGTVASTFDMYFTTKSYVDKILTNYVASTDLETKLSNSTLIKDLSSKVTNVTSSNTIVTKLDSYFTQTKIGGTTTNPLYSVYSNFPLQTNTAAGSKTDNVNGIKGTETKYDSYFTTKKYCDDNYAAKLPAYPAEMSATEHVLVLGTDGKLKWAPVTTSTESPVGSSEPGLYYIITS